MTSESKILEVAEFLFDLDIPDLKSFKEILAANHVEPKVDYEFTHSHNIHSFFEHYKINLSMS